MAFKSVLSNFTFYMSFEIRNASLFRLGTLGEPHHKKTVFVWALPKQRFDPLFCAHSGTLWHIFFAENEKILETAILTSGTNILTETMVKTNSEMVF